MENIDVNRLNDADRATRLETLRVLADRIKRGEMPASVRTDAVNNHIHTFYSFSPYSPAMAVWKSCEAGLSTAGIMDHDTLSGVVEFIEAGAIMDLPVTVGVEVRADFSATPLAGRRINHPDQLSSAYIAIHGIPHTQFETVEAFLQPYRMLRGERNRKMTARLNDLLRGTGVELDYERDVITLSKQPEGGSVTERHILFALAVKLEKRFGRGRTLLEFLRNGVKIDVPARFDGVLSDPNNPYFLYDLLGVLKSDLVPAFYIDATDECAPVTEIVALANQVGAICAYAYLGDVGVSVTGDKQSLAFEDEYLDLLFEILKELGFHAVTYMPSRNTLAQLERVQKMCDRYGFFQISGEDINSPRQNFVCEAILRPEFSHLKTSTWALIGHEKAATRDLHSGLFSPGTILEYPDLKERIRIFSEIGKDTRQSVESK